MEIVTQWPGRAAEEVEQQVTIPLEIAVNGIPHLEHLRSISMFGLSNLILIFDDESDNDWNRQKVRGAARAGRIAATVWSRRSGPISARWARSTFTR